MDARDVDILLRFQDHFESAGFAVEFFGGRTVQVSEVPHFMDLGEVRKVLLELVDALIRKDGLGATKKLAYEGFAAQVAVTEGRNARWNEGEAEQLLNDLFKCDLPYCDSAGKPTLVQISHQELKRKFGRS